jgi:pyruvate dehydrogenase E1 component
MPTVILAKTVKGYGMGHAGESQEHHPLSRRRWMTPRSAPSATASTSPFPIRTSSSVPFYHPGADSPEVKYMLERRAALGGALPHRRRKSESLPAPELSALEQLTKGTGEREISTTMAFVRGMNLLLRDKAIGPRVVPIVADEARTFGMEGMFRQIGIYAPFGQKYKPMDADQLMYYREDQSGQVLQQGISEPGAFSSWMAGLPPAIR